MLKERKKKGFSDFQMYVWMGVFLLVKSSTVQFHANFSGGDSLEDVRALFLYIFFIFGYGKIMGSS